MRTSLGALALAALLSACGGSTADEATLRAQLREEVRAEMEAEAAQAARRNQPQHVDVEMPEVERYLVDTAHAPARGASAPLVTIVTFSDFQCPFCGRVQPTLERLLRAHPDEVRLVFRNNPLPFHQEAMPAAEAALEAYDQGGDAMFWRYHDLLFANQQSLDRASLERYAAQVGMDATRLADALDRHTHRARIQEDQAETNARGARGTPAFFLNGRQLMGAQPYERFEEIVEEELALARRLMEAGVPRGGLYAHLMQDARTEAAPEPEAAPLRAQRRPDPDAIYRVPVGNQPQQGPDDALVTIVEVAEFECPFCARVQPTLEQLRQRYGSDLRIVFRHNPLPFHQNAMPAAEAAAEVYAQGGASAFHRYAAILFENQRELTRDNLLAWATQVGVSAADVDRALSDHRHRPTIEADQRLAQSLGASGTPSFFINGRLLRGAQPYEAFERAVNDALTRARAEVARGTPRAQVYARLIEDGATSPQLLPGGEPEPARPAPDHVYAIPVPSGAPSRGPADAPVTLQLWSDFQCPFCNRIRPTLDQIVQHYGNQVRVVWRDYPLPFHQNAMPAARAAREVHRQGGDRAFWEFHDLVFDNQRNLTTDELVRLAGTVRGVNARRVRQVLESDRYEAEVRADMQAVTDAGARIGTPSVFVEGRLIQGAQPFAAFQAAIDAALAAP
ncbi:MAG: thioredoxin domain-containing protein [Myxococcota bacterium]|nr:thioredoxin domain-containing protein [Myxococcota bacterium]